MRNFRSSTAVLLALAACTNAAWAQRAGDNAVAEAQDAFGTSVGNENIGLYSSGSARGFSPAEAGNLRIEGLYFDQQANLGNRLVRGSTVRVGLSAQSYPFPAPTGIADFQLRIPGEVNIVSTVATYGSERTFRFEVDSQINVMPEKFAAAVGASFYRDGYVSGTTANLWTGGTILRIRPTENIEIIPFWAREERTSSESNTHRMLPAPGTLPPKMKRYFYQSQDWSAWTLHHTNYGVLSRANVGDDWTVRGGIFRSSSTNLKSFVSVYRNIQQDRTATLTIQSNPLHYTRATSGEVRVTKVMREGPRQHALHVTGRGRDADRQFGGGHTVNFGTFIMGINRQVPAPTFVHGPTSHDNVKQGTGGVGYEGLWNGIGEFSAGVQRTYIKRLLIAPNLPDTRSADHAWLYNGTVAFYPTRELVVYAGYTRGVEESGVAPETAANYGEPQPANRTKQVDAGIRYAITPQLRLVAGVFQVQKPYLNRDNANIFTQVGAVKNEGIEFSLSGPVAPGLRMIAGAVLIRARVSGLLVDQGQIGHVPPGETPRTLRLNLQYGPASWRGFSVDGQVVNQDNVFADLRNTFKAPGSTTFDIGGRYQFKLGQSPASIRLQVTNLFNNYFWQVAGSSGLVAPSLPRRFGARMSVDF